MRLLSQVSWRERACHWSLPPHLRYSRKVPTYRIKEAASLLGVSADTLRRWAMGGVSKRSLMLLGGWLWKE